MKRVSKTNNIEINNVENIIKIFQSKFKVFAKILKYDGITIEFTLNDNCNRDDIVKQVKQLCKSYSLNSHSIELNKNDEKKFILQFPDLVPEYTKTEIDNMYIENFKWLLDDSLRNKPDLSKDFISLNADKYVKLAIKTYFRSNVNRYREKEETYLNDFEYRSNLKKLFQDYLDKYF